ncbi:MAG: hypothetical protein AVDCRST_MAG17-1590 [uncultured Solirubrobacterales bacterium]|uniref:SGNH hydrolase-type esterase domain-containing protein n=1 Tax=uncultured Solirubrobacterales bacterium TaxID=768556 RepID=A0A6J4SSY8_9ACTN|nr:MAG: hypothetical protein AVDCRST_MAG17-1590 [uncultured Solirubrobacterales bacterium]
MGGRGRISFIVALASLTLAAPVAHGAQSQASTIQQNGGGTSTANGSAQKPTAAVSLGDSYISGEAGRWRGNSINPAGSRDGTDRAFTGTGYDISRVYIPPSDRNGCHRSDVAEIRSAALPVQQKLNISCSGAVTKNIFRSSRGGQGQNGERPQTDQLASIARRKKVRLIALSIGGNDFGFASIVSACLQAYTTAGPPCEPRQQAAINAKKPMVRAGVAKAIDEIRATMRGAGYRRSSYRLILQSYPSAIPRGSEIRVPEIDRNRRINVDGCPVYNSDATWARDSVVHQISNNLRTVAANKGVQFLDLRNLLQGREMCSVSTRLATPLRPPSPTASDWARFLNVSAVQTQGQLQETFHPNAYGQRAFGKCLSLIVGQRRNAGCRNTPGAGPGGVVLRPSG